MRGREEKAAYPPETQIQGRRLQPAGKVRLMLRVVHETDPNAEDAVAPGAGAAGPDLDELCRLAAREMIAVALEAERRAWLDAHAEITDATGRRLVVGNGYLPERTITTGAGRVEVKAPRVADKRPEGQREPFSSSILPRYMRKSPKVTEVLPVLYLRGLSTGDFAPALEGFFGSDAGLSASTVNRLCEAWQAEHQRWSTRDLSTVDYVYMWADGVYPRVRLPDAEGNRDPLCLLVIVGVRADGTKELVTVADGYRESTESWAEVLRDLRGRGMTAPVLAVGDGALGLWNALGQVWPATLQQRCWVHKTARVLAALPKRLHPRAKELLHAISYAASRTDALAAAKVFADELAAYPKAVTKIMGELDVLLTFYDFPEPHWKHLRTTNPIESTFSTVRLRTRVTKGAGNRAAAVAMAYKLLDAAQHRWRRIRAPELVPLVRAGATFIDGQLQERSNQHHQDTNEVCAA
jgi:putative transposase